MNELQKSLNKCKVEGNVLSLPPISDGVLSNYNEVKKALINAGATYKKNTFVFPNDAQPYIDKLMGGEKVNIKKEFQFFGTPDILADELVSLAQIAKNDIVLEPSAGQGAIINAVQRIFPKKEVLWCELMEINRNVLMKSQGDKAFIYGDFLKIDMPKYFDKIIANPPFAKNQDIDHIRKMYECLKKGGKIVSIASNHWRFSKNKKETLFQDWLTELGAVVIEIKAGAFKESGTNISACIVIIDKE